MHKHYSCLFGTSIFLHIKSNYLTCILYLEVILCIGTVLNLKTNTAVLRAQFAREQWNFVPRCFITILLDHFLESFFNNILERKYIYISHTHTHIYIYIYLYMYMKNLLSVIKDSYGQNKILIWEISPTRNRSSNC